MIILKILLWILLAVLILLFLVCLLNVKITLGNRSEKFEWKLTVGGIKIDPMRFLKMKDGHRKKGNEKKAAKKSFAKNKAAVKTEELAEKKEKQSIGSVLNIISMIAETAAEVLPKGFRIRLKHLNMVIGGADAAQTALNYGKAYAILSGIFALFDGYKGLFYGFRAKRSKVNIQADFLSDKTKAEYELTISFFIWQLLFSGIRIGISAIAAIIENANEDGTVNSSDISEAAKTVNKSKADKDIHKGTATKTNKDNGGK